VTRFDGAQSRLSPSSSGKKQRAVAAGTSGAAVRPCALQTGELLVFSVLLGVVALVFLPSLYSQFTLPKLAVFYPVLGLAALCWFARYRRGDTIAIRASIAVPILALLAWWTVTLPFAVDIPRAVWGAAGRGNGFLQHVALLIVFAGLATLRIGEGGVRRLVAALMTILVVLSAYAIAQAAGVDLFTWPNVRPGSTVGHPVPLAAMLALGLPIGLALIFVAATRRQLAAAACATLVIGVALAMTLSRGPWIGAICGSIATLALLFRLKGGRHLKALAVAAAAIIALGVVVSVARVPGTRVTQRIALIARATTDPSFMNRFEYFSAALAMVRERPLIGSGFETFGLRFPPFRPIENPTVDDDTIPTMVHNGYLERAVWTGIPGLLLYVTLMAAVAASLLNVIRERAETSNSEQRALACGVLGGLTAFWIQDLSGWQEISSSVFFWALAGLAVGLCRQGSANRSGEPPRSEAVRNGGVVALLAFACAAVLVVCTWHVWGEAAADARLAQAHRAGVAAGWREAKTLLEETRPLVNGDPSYLDRIAVVYLDRLRSAPDPDAYRAAREVLREARAHSRFDPYILIHVVDAETLARLLGLTKTMSSEAVDAAVRVVELDPNNPTVHQTLARFQLVSGHLTAALTEVHTARALRPNRAGLSLLEGDILRAAGDKRAALDAYRNEAALHASANSTWITAQQKVTAAVIEAGDYQAAIREAEALVARTPADPTSHRLLDAARAMRAR
jgi:O-antigen ligase